MFDGGYRPRLADLRPLVATAPTLAPTFAEPEARTAAAAFEGRTGYDPAFLGDFQVDLPVAGGDRAGDVLPVKGNEAGRLDYLHFSIVMSKSRKLAMVTAVNIDGGAAGSVPRDGDPWAYDGRIADDAQVGPDLYTNNDIDRGHLVRRQDPIWGADPDTANRDTFHYTNCSPQMAAFNQRTWLSLEDYILGNTKTWKERATVFTGPVFGEKDPLYRGVLIPLSYWKVVAFLSDDGKPSATAYRIEQDVDLGQMSLLFGPFKTYQTSIASIETLTGLSFGPLSGYDGFSNEEAATGGTVKRLITGPGDILI